jgi:hypothetical protein
MTLRFDPYHKWLGIPPEEQPPHHYRLLGLRPFESDADAISNAADRQMRHLKTYAASVHGAAAEDLLDAVAKARVCLLNPGKKEVYDQELRAKLGEDAGTSQVREAVWIPPLGGIKDTFDILCPHCDESFNYALSATPRAIPCTHCHQQVRVPGRQELKKALAGLTPPPTTPAHQDPSEDGLEDFFEALKTESAGDSQPAIRAGGSITRIRRRARRRPRWLFVQVVLGSLVGITLAILILRWCGLDIPLFPPRGKEVGPARGAGVANPNATKKGGDGGEAETRGRRGNIGFDVKPRIEPGLEVSYFDGTMLDPARHKRTETVPNVDWHLDGGPLDSDGNAIEGMWVNNFSILYSGFLKAPKSGYKLYVASDDGVRVHLDGKLVFDRWQRQGPELHKIDAALTGQVQPIRIEYFEWDGHAKLELLWRGEDDAKAMPIPADAFSHDVRKSFDRSAHKRVIPVGQLRYTNFDEALNNVELVLELIYPNGNLAQLPKDVGNFWRLEKLDLSSNKLSSLPDAVEFWSSLRELDLSNNELAKLQTQVEFWGHLEHADLSGNELIDLPPHVGQWGWIRQLDLSDNRLTSMPKETWAWGQLERLDLSNNQLNTLPDGIEHWRRLRELDLRGNQFIQSEIDRIRRLLQPNVNIESDAKKSADSNPDAVPSSDKVPAQTDGASQAPPLAPRQDLRVWIGQALSGREPGNREALLAAGGGSRRTENAVSLGLAWLARQQRPDGLWSLSGPYSGGAKQENAEAATALALLAYLGAGETEHPRVRRGSTTLLKRLDGDGRFFHDVPEQHQLYTQALCTLAVCELYALTRDEKYKEPAERAIDYCIRAQSPQGGWRYKPGVESDMSVTGWFVSALLTARMAGIEVPNAVFDQVDRFLDSVARDDGSRYAYRLRDGATMGMTASGLLCRQYLGWPRDDKRLLAGVDSLMASLPDWDKRNVYYWYYATQVLHHIQGDDWKKWNDVIRELLLSNQVTRGSESGSWDPMGDRWGGQPYGGRLFVTCLSIYILEAYYRHLPIYSAETNTD